MFLSKYGVARHIYIPVVKRAVVDFAVSADWTPVAGDVKISKDGGAAANVTNLPTAIAMGNGAIWDFSLTATEMQAAQVVVTVADSATKAVEDQSFIIETYGNASGQHAVDLADSVRAGLTALPNVASGSAGAIPTTGTGANQISVSSGQVILQAGSGTGQLDFTSGVVKANLAQILGTALTETAGLLAGGFKKFFNVSSPTGTLNSIPDAVAGATGGLFIAGTNAATTVTTALTTTFTGNLTGSVASVTGAVGSVTARVTANTDQLAGQTVTAAAGVTFPTSVASPTNITAGTITTTTNLTTNNDKTGYALTAAYDPAKTASQAGDAMALTAGERTSLNTVIKTTAVTEAYRANGAAPTEAQFMCEVLAHLGESSIAGTTKTINKLDHVTAAETFTLDSAVTPASITRAS